MSNALPADRSRRSTRSPLRLRAPVPTIDQCAEDMLTRHGRIATKLARERALSEYDAGAEQAAAYWAVVHTRLNDLIRLMC